MIPKIIHYCWFGNNPMPEPALRCIESWKRYCPDYVIVRWDESNVDIAGCPPYVQEAYARKKWAFVTDYIRLKVVYEHGGIYLDTDVELLKPLDDLLVHSMFLGCEGTQSVATGLGFGAEKGFSFLRENMAIYEEMDPVDDNGGFVSFPCPYYTTKLCKDKGITFPITDITTTGDGMTIYPNSFFNPYDWKFEKLKITSNTYSIHHYNASWMPEMQKKSLVHEAKAAVIERYFGKYVAKVYTFCFWAKIENGGPGVVKRFWGKLGVK